MKNDWANDHKAVLAADSLKSYVLQLHTIKSLRSALAEDNFMATERGDTLEDFYDAFDNEINRYVTKKDVMEVFPEMEPGSEDFEDGIKIGQLNMAVYEIMKEVNTLYGSVGEAHPNKKLSDLVELDDSSLLRSVTKKDISESGTLRNFVENKYPAKIIIGVATEKNLAYINNQTADGLMSKFARDILARYPDGNNFNKCVASAILSAVSEIYMEKKEQLEKNPAQTLGQMNTQPRERD